MEPGDDLGLGRRVGPDDAVEVHVHALADVGGHQVAAQADGHDGGICAEQTERNVHRRTQPTTNALLVSFRLSSDAEFFFFQQAPTEHADWRQTCKNVCAMSCVFQLSFHFAYHRWWLGSRTRIIALCKCPTNKGAMHNGSSVRDSTQRIQILHVGHPDACSVGTC